MEKAIELFKIGAILMLMSPFPPYFRGILLCSGLALIACALVSFKLSDNTKLLVVTFILAFIFLMTVPLSSRSGASLGYGFIAVYHDYLRIMGQPVPEYYY